MKAGIVHEGSTLVTSTQERSAMEPLLRRANAVGAKLVPEGRGFEVTAREVALGGQLVTIETRAARYQDLFLPLHGEYQAHNAALALAAAEVLLGAGEPKALDAEVVGEAFVEFSSPGRLELVRNAPTVILDAAHNPAGMEAMTKAVDEEFNFRKLVGVVGMLADKEADHMLELLEPILDEIVVTKSSSDRAMPAATLAKLAREVFGEERVHVYPHLPRRRHPRHRARRGGRRPVRIRWRRPHHRLGLHRRRRPQDPGRPPWLTRTLTRHPIKFNTIKR